MWYSILMNIYFSGIGGVAIGPLAQIALDAGYSVGGSDREASPMTDQLKKRGVSPHIGKQDGTYLKQSHSKLPVDWLVHTSALPPNHPELSIAKELGIKTAKRDELISHIISKHNLKLIAVAGTHGKTTTTGMIVWLAKYFGIPISYSVGATLSWGPSGKYTSKSEYFVYECDEFDQNFLSFHPKVSLVTSIEHDHIDTYPTKDSYFEAFRQFSDQSETLFTWQQYQSILGDSSNITYLSEISQYARLKGSHNRHNASLILAALKQFGLPAKYAADGLNKFPGTSRRFEKLADNLFTDYGHTPTEISATLQTAKEISNKVALIYQPHQNIRQHQIRDDYTPTVFQDADQVYWLPTYLSREDPELKQLTPAELTSQLPKGSVHIANPDSDLWQAITKLRQDNYLVLVMGAGDIDAWVRGNLS